MFSSAKLSCRIEVALSAALMADWIVCVTEWSLSPKVSAGAGALGWTEGSPGAGASRRGGN
eukprot:scaffold89728_cov28-Phaeocystis_antarctica.AAC.1